MIFLLLACTGVIDDTATKSADSDPSDTDDTSGTTDTDPTVGETVTMETTLGSMTIVLDPEHAPVTVENFLTYVDEGFYDGQDGLGATIFHRVIAGFMDQGGGVTADGVTKSTHAAIVLEADNGLSNLRGTIAMARTNQPDSATSQFFINTVDNTFLDSTGNNDGYAVFGALSAGLDTIDAIAAARTDGNDQPLEDIVITSCTR